MKVSRTDKSMLLRAFLKKGGWTLLSFSFLFLLWYIVALIVGNAYLLPSLGETIKASGRLLMDQDFWSAYVSTLMRSFAGFFISFIVAGFFALLTCYVAELEKFFAPILSLLRSLPTMAILLIIILWTSASVAPIVVSVLVLLPMLYSAMLGSKTAVNTELIEMSKVYGVPQKIMIKQLVLPSVYSSLSREALASLTLALKLTVSAEIMANTFQSLGGAMQTANLYAQTSSVFALAMIVFLTGFVLECVGLCATKYIERRFL